MRIRIALGTAMAVIVLPVLLFALFSSTSAATARMTRHEAISQHRTVKINDKLMSYAQAEKVAKLATFSNAVAAQQEATYLKDVAFITHLKEIDFLKAVQLQQQQQAAQQAAAAAAAAAAQARAAAAQAQAATAAAQAQAAAAPPAAAPAPTAATSDATSTNTADWACIREHESSDDYGAGNGGAYQFEFGTWHTLTGLPSAAEDYPASVQDSVALELFAQRGWEPWTTRYVCGL